MSTRIFSKSLSKKISAIFILLIFSIILFQGIILYYSFRKSFSDTITNIFSISVEQNEERFTKIFNNFKAVRENINFYENIFVEPLKGNNEIEIYNIFTKNNTNFLGYFNNLTDFSNKPYVCIFILENKNSLLYKVAPELDSAGFKLNSNGIYKEGSKNEVWIKKILERSDAISDYSIRISDNIFYTVNTIYKTDENFTRTAMGKLIVGFDASYLKQNTDQSSSLNNSKIIVFDSNKSIIYTSDNKMADINYYDINKNDSGDKSDKFNVREIVIGQTAYLYKLNNISDDNIMLSMIPVSDINSKTNNAISIIFFVFLFSIVIVIFIVVKVSNIITKPINRLSDIMNQTKYDKEVLPVTISSGDEISLLYTSFNKLNARISELIAEQKELTERQKETEIRALQAQINPHFIFNTIDTVCCLALLRGEDDISDALSLLAEIIRYNMRNPDDLVLISEEIEYLDNYLQIHRLRSENEINIEIDFSEETFNCFIPKLIIQPLVENSLLHAIYKTKTEGKILICGNTDGNSLVITICDNGELDSTDEINRYINGDKSVYSNKNSFGIKNVNERIKFKFGKEYGLVYSKSDGYTMAKIIIPKIQK